MCYNRYSGSNHWGWGRYGGGVKTQGWGKNTGLGSAASHGGGC